MYHVLDITLHSSSNLIFKAILGSGTIIYNHTPPHPIHTLYLRRKVMFNEVKLLKIRESVYEGLSFKPLSL